MSQEQFKAFTAKVQEDSSLQEQLKAEGADVIAIAKAAGFTIKQQDLHAAASELSDEDLEAAAGGTNQTTVYTPTLGPITISIIIK